MVQRMHSKMIQLAALPLDVADDLNDGYRLSCLTGSRLLSFDQVYPSGIDPQALKYRYDLKGI